MTAVNMNTYATAKTSFKR